MMDYTAIFENAVEMLKREKRYRVFADIERMAGRFPHALWRSPAGVREIVGTARQPHQQGHAPGDQQIGARARTVPPGQAHDG